MKSIPVLIALVGLPGSGKSVVSDVFRESGYSILRFGDQTDIGLSELGLPRTEENERMYREKIRKELGMAAMAIKIEPRIHTALKTTDHVVLDGMRSLDEYLYLKERFPSIFVVSVYAPPAVRYQRLSIRKERPLTVEEASSRDIAELRVLQSGGPIALADCMIDNTGSIDSLKKQVALILAHV